ncbi:hypothetical protein A5685_05195 [Mycobacterium colombiense]|uniref:Uncharacterized protein n=1 Tax=Mycobacterium colombiense TaxID=339268 RepID=A0A1A2S3I4_9MYCO|nr:hypothetical protein [Mycobacterium colombiense]OBH58776.1 hypothetical protein A5685_05195 [Mycobacterium colombiense]
MVKSAVDHELVELIEARIKKDRAQLTRQRHGVTVTLRDMHHAIRDGLANGMSPTRLAKLSGLHVSRIYQIGADDDSKLI